MKRGLTIVDWHGHKPDRIWNDKQITDKDCERNCRADSLCETWKLIYMLDGSRSCKIYHKSMRELEKDVSKSTTGAKFCTGEKRKSLV